MARVQNPLIGKASGSVGGATFSTWKGINVLKSKPETVANPNTIGQQKQRSKMRIAVSIYRLIATIITFGFKQQAVAKSAYNAFVADALNNALTGNPDGSATIDYTKLKLSKGTVGITAISNVVATAGDVDVDVDFNGAQLPAGGSASDRAMVAVYNSTKDEWTTDANAGQRSDAGVGVSLQSAPASGDQLYIYLAFYNAQEGTSSDSVVQSIVVA